MIVITQRCYRLLELLCTSYGFISVRTIADELKVSERTARYDISLLADWLFEKGISLQNVPKKGICIEEAGAKQARAFLIDYQTNTINKEIFLNTEARANIIIGYILEGKVRKTINNMATSFGVSRTTLIRDLVKVDDWFITRGYEVLRDRKIGFYIDVDEIQRRRLMVEFIIEHVGNNSFFQQLGYQEMGLRKSYGLQGSQLFAKYIVESEKFKEVIEDSNLMFSEINIHVSDNSFIWFVYYIAVSYARLEAGNSIVVFPQKYNDFQDSRISCKVENQFRARNFENISEENLINEAAYLTARIIAATKSDTENVKTYNNELSKNVFEYFVDTFEKETGYNLCNDVSLAESLKMHLYASIARVQLKIQTQNGMIEEIRNSFSDIYEICHKIFLDIKDNFGMDFDENEIGFITLYVATSMNKGANNSSSKKVRVVLICGYGVGTVSFLKKSLEREFPSIEIIKKLPAYEIGHYDFNEVDLVLTTIDIPFLLQKSLIRVKPIITKIDIRRIASFLRIGKIVIEKETQDFKIEELLSIIEENCEVNDTQNLVESLKKTMGSYSKLASSPVDLPSLRDIIPKRNILAKVDVGDWEDAVRKSSQVLIDNNCITPEYVESIIDMKDKYDHYSVISKGVCMLHATPRALSKLAVSLTTVKKPVTIRVDGEVCLIKVFLVLSVVDQMSHAKALDEVFCLFDEFPSLVEELYNAKKNAELFRIFKDYYHSIF